MQQTLELAAQYYQHGRLEDARLLLEQIIQSRPDHHVALHLLGLVMRAFGHSADAERFIRSAIALDARQPEYHNSLGILLAELGKSHEAIESLREALRLKPDYRSAMYNLAIALTPHDVDAAIEQYRAALRIKPDYAPAANNLGDLLSQVGRVDEAVACLRQAMAAAPDNVTFHNNLIFTLHFHIKHDMWSIRHEHLRWQEIQARPLRQFIRTFDNDRDPDRRLRVGYLSPNFYTQAECFFVVPLLEAHDREQVEIHCYSDTKVADEVTHRLRRAAAVWRDVRGMSDQSLAEQIRADRIDVLVDLTMHMAHNRLRVFARKPAPVQVSWLAYPGCTAVDAIEYRLTDRYLDPVGDDNSWSIQKPVRLPDCGCCYLPLFDVEHVDASPSAAAGYVTFGALNNPCKLNEQVLELWSRVLAAVPNARLVLRQAEGSPRRELSDFFTSHQIPAQRIEFSGLLSREDYLRLYNRIDVALDTFPYNGITTTCDALWMGVPVVTLSGKTPASRAGLGLLSTVGLQQFAAATPHDFVEIATRVASDRTGLNDLRRSLRRRMTSSPLLDAPRFARNVEAAFREMWKRWCRG